MARKRRDKGNNRFYYKFFKLLKLEGATKYGRINLAGVAIIAVFCIVYTATDFIQNIIQIFAAAYKTKVLQKNIEPSLEGISVIEAVIPVFVAFSLCLILLYRYEKSKLNINKAGEENENI